MKSQIKGFISGALVSALVLGGAVSALAVSGNISFNLSAIKFNGEVISEAGEGYTLPNGCVAPASITYTDEKGGGTTYLPARRVSELLGVDIGWDAASGAVTIGKTEQPVTPDTTANVPDYSDWSAEDEAAYQEWKAMWKVKVENTQGGLLESERHYEFTYIGNETCETVEAAMHDFENSKANLIRHCSELWNGEVMTALSVSYFHPDERAAILSFCRDATRIWVVGELYEDLP